jgi:hypothetical protein
VQFVLVPVTLLALVAQLVWAGGRRSTVANVLRSICLAGAAGLFLHRAVNVMPDLNGHLQSYRTAAEGGDLERAATERAAFDVIHPWASDLYQGAAMLLVLAVAISAFAAGGATTVKAAPKTAEPELASAYR